MRAEIELLALGLAMAALFVGGDSTAEDEVDPADNTDAADDQFLLLVDC